MDRALIAQALGRWPWFALPLLLAFCAMLSLASWPGDIDLVGSAAFAFSLFVMVLCIVGLVPYAKRREAELYDRLDRLRDSGPTQTTVILCLLREGELLGFDQGLASVVDGRLYYVGLRTSFGFSSKSARFNRLPRLEQYIEPVRFRQERLGMRFFEFERDGVSYEAGLRSPFGAPNDPWLQWLLASWDAPSEELSSVELLPPTIPPPDALDEFKMGRVHAFVACSMLAAAVNALFLGRWFSPIDSSPDLAPRLLAAGVLSLAAVAAGLWASVRLEKRRLELFSQEGSPKAP